MSVVHFMCALPECPTSAVGDATCTLGGLEYCSSAHAVYDVLRREAWQNIQAGQQPTDAVLAIDAGLMDILVGQRSLERDAIERLLGTISSEFRTESDVDAITNFLADTVEINDAPRGSAVLTFPATS